MSAQDSNACKIMRHNLCKCCDNCFSKMPSLWHFKWSIQRAHKTNCDVTHCLLQMWLYIGDLCLLFGFWQSRLCVFVPSVISWRQVFHNENLIIDWAEQLYFKWSYVYFTDLSLWAGSSSRWSTHVWTQQENTEYTNWINRGFVLAGEKKGIGPKQNQCTVSICVFL